MFSVNFTTITPLCQIDGGGDKITVKRMPVLVDIDGSEPKFLQTPVYTANGFRGLLRRTGFELILEAMMKNGMSGKDIGGPTNFHLMNAGGGNNYQDQSISVENKVREMNPLISVFGASLAVEGKLIVDNLVPKRHNGDHYDYCYALNEDSGSIWSNIVGVRTFIKKDDMLDHTGNAVYMSSEEIADWESHVSENQALRKATKDKGDEKVKKETIKHIQEQEYVISGTTFYGALETKMPLTDIEKGMIIRILERVTHKRLGAGVNSGHGKIEYSIEFMDGCSLVSHYEDPNNLKCKTSLVLNDEGKKCVEAFDVWLKNINAANVQLDKILI
jgi:CRISPR type IV-associated protein Csf2